MNNDYQRDEVLWRIAKKRASFKWSFSAYVFINTFLICVWCFSSGPQSYFWPVWVILSWGVGLLFKYLEAYQGNNIFTAEQEYERLKNQQNQQL
jgi:hypothetical protein